MSYAHSPGSSVTGTYAPPGAVQCSVYEKSDRHSRPVKKIGSDTPASAVPMANRSKTLPLRSADSTPVATPLSSQMIAAPAASDPVTVIRSVSSGQTGFCVRNEYPKQGAGQCSTVGPVL